MGTSIFNIFHCVTVSHIHCVTVSHIQCVASLRQRILSTAIFILFIISFWDISTAVPVDGTSVDASRRLQKDLHHLASQFQRDHILGTSSETKSKSQLFQRLTTCYETDARCALLLGNHYFQGTIPSGFGPPDDDTKNLTRALGLWTYAAQRGHPEAQFNLGLVYSLYFNPPTFMKDPGALYDSIANESLQGIHDSGADAARPFHEFLASPVDGSDESTIHLLYRSLEVLDASVSPDDAWETELSVITSKEAVGMAERQLNQFSVVVDASFGGGGQCARKSHIDDETGSVESDGASLEAKSIRETIGVRGSRFMLHTKPSLALMYYYAAAEGGHVGARLALAFRHLYALDVPRRCHAAAAHYAQIARDVAQISARGIPPVAEMVKLDVSGVSRTELEDDLQRRSRRRTDLSHLQLHLAREGHPKMKTTVGKKYLLGLDGFQQDPEIAVRYFVDAAHQGYKEAFSCLGYLAVLGIGIKKDLDLAYRLFKYGATSNEDMLGHNGLGYLHFIGTNTVQQDSRVAFRYFNISASRGFPDASFNVAACYLTGMGVHQSFPKALQWLARGVEHGHTGALYLLGIIHLNGLGAPRDCGLAVDLLKRVAERHPWVADHLQKATLLHASGLLDEASFLFWALAESGSEFAQSTLAQLLDGGGKPLSVWAGTDGVVGWLRYIGSYLPGISSQLFTPTALFSPDYYPSIGINRCFAHRYWDLAALQNSPQASVRLGDYAYHGWGIEAPHETEEVTANRKEDLLVDSEGVSMEGWGLPRRRHDVYQTRLSPNFHQSFEFYERAASLQHHRLSEAKMKATRPSIVRAEFSLAMLHQAGDAYPADFNLARRHLNRVGELEETARLPVQLASILLKARSFFSQSKVESVRKAVRQDTRLILIASNLALIVSFLCIRPILKFFV